MRDLKDVLEKNGEEVSFEEKREFKVYYRGLTFTFILKEYKELQNYRLGLFETTIEGKIEPIDLEMIKTIYNHFWNSYSMFVSPIKY